MNRHRRQGEEARDLLRELLEFLARLGPLLVGQPDQPCSDASAVPGQTVAALCPTYLTTAVLHTGANHAAPAMPVSRTATQTRWLPLASTGQVHDQPEVRDTLREK